MPMISHIISSYDISCYNVDSRSLIRPVALVLQSPDLAFALLSGDGCAGTAECRIVMR